jgi:hypothetical protein
MWKLVMGICMTIGAVPGTALFFERIWRSL